MRLLNSIDRTKINQLPLFVTLTYPGSWPEDPRSWKKHLEAFKEALRRKYGKVPAIWRLEFQRRGAPHFHLLLFLEANLADLIIFVSKTWYRVVGSGDFRHEMAGTRCEHVRSWKGVNAYAAKYMAKDEKLLPGAKSAGRFWGVWYKDDLPIAFENTSISLENYFRLRRIMRRYARTKAHRGEMYRVGCFLGYETSNRLLAHLGVSRT